MLHPLLNVLQSLMTVLYPIQKILFLMLVYHPLNKAHGYDDISIKLLKICDSSIVKPPYTMEGYEPPPRKLYTYIKKWCYASGVYK